MENNFMKITELKINKLHGYTDYDVKFNDDITFLYGDNGCGKTTILNIITYIITGKIYELFRYRFESVALHFISTATKKRDKIIISYSENNIVLEYANEKIEIDYQRFDYMSRNPEESDEVERFYFSEYSILKQIRDTFNYLYLPLNRNGNIHIDYPYNSRTRKMMQNRYLHSKNRIDAKMDLTLLGVEELVSSAYSKVNFILNKISEQLVDDLLKSFLDGDNIPSMDQIVTYMYSLDESKIRHIQSEYIAVLKSLKKWDEQTDTKINAFFDTLEESMITAKKGGEQALTVGLLFQLSELTKINNIITKAERAEQAKNKVRQPIEDFLNTVNGFIQSNNSTKRICLDNDGTIYLKTKPNKEIDIYQLSSGEKQIVTFFAYLVFGLQKTNQSIFIVDEPELSLHLNWQRIFVDSILSINNNVQLIFATHAPEMIGRHREKAVKLIPNN